MRTNYVLIDYENVQPKDLRLLNGHAFKVLVFVGASQARIPTDFADAMQERGENAKYVRASGNGRNALDFHIAFHLGHLTAADPEGFYHVISKDTGFDPLIKHLKSRGISARRSSGLAEIPILDLSKSVDERLDAILKDLKNRGPARPRKRKTLASTINSLFGKRLAEGEVDELISVLEKCGTVKVKEGAVTYRF